MEKRYIFESKMARLFALLYLALLSDNVIPQEISTVQTVHNHTHIERILHEIEEEHNHHDDHDHEHDNNNSDVIVSNYAEDYKTWVFASLSVLGISLCGVFGVIIIPIMQKIFYQHLLQFLIALAVGTLSGDALLHLLPHALLPGHDEGHEGHHVDVEDVHNRAIWLGLVAVGAVILFYFFEKFVNIIQEWRSRRKTNQSKMSEDDKNGKERKPPIVVREGHEVSDRVKGESKCIQKYSNYCVSDLDTNLSTPESCWSTNTSASSGDKTNNNSGSGCHQDMAGGDCRQQREQETVIISQHEVGQVS